MIPIIDEGEGPLLVLAHGAGAGMEHAWLTGFSARLTAANVRVVRFEFPYMAARRTGSRRPPDRMPVLEKTFLDVIERVRRENEPFVVGGKSMGGRAATHVARAARASGVVALGYPFHPPEKPAQLRTAHLQHLDVDTLIVHGTRDPFGTPDEIATYGLSSAITVRFVDDGDHDLKPRKRETGRSHQEALDEVAEWVASFVHEVSARRRENARTLFPTLS